MIVSFIVVAYNAENTIGSLFECLKKQTYPQDLIEVILVDGDSRDNTKKRMEAFAKSTQFRRTVVLNNPGRTLPCGWNVALAEVQGEVVLRLDAHATMPDDFIERNVRHMKEGKDICCGKVLSKLDDAENLGRIVNLAENSMFGGSVAAFRRAEKPGYVNTGAFAMYRKTVFDAVGLYDERLARTEDNEMHYRMKKAGFRFYYDPELVTYRQTRPSFGKLTHQKYMNGYWIGLTMGIELRCFSLYHFVPLAFVLGILFTSVIASLGFWQPAALMWLMYAAAATAMTVAAVVGSGEQSACCMLLPWMFLCLHVSYGLGTLIGLMKAPFWLHGMKKNH